MSSLIYVTDENQALVATDTLAVSPGGEPFKFTSKAFYVPHLRMVIAGVGAGTFLDHRLLVLNTYLIVSGIDDVDRFATENLQVLWAEFPARLHMPEQTTTVYHFGFSEQTGQMKLIAYRSTQGFASDVVPNGGLGRKPDCTVPDPWNLPEDFKSMMRDQRTRQEAVPAEGRVYIGGEMIVYQLTREGCAIWTLDRFEDYDSVLATVTAKRKS